MMRFNSTKGLIIVNTRLYGPSGDIVVRLALDTGASSTVVRNALLVTIGYNPSASLRTVSLTTGSRVESATRIEIDRLAALGHERVNFSVIAYTLPGTAAVDGVLGLDFLRNHYTRPHA